MISYADIIVILLEEIVQLVFVMPMNVWSRMEKLLYINPQVVTLTTVKNKKIKTLIVLLLIEAKVFGNVITITNLVVYQRIHKL